MRQQEESDDDDREESQKLEELKTMIEANGTIVGPLMFQVAFIRVNTIPFEKMRRSRE